MWLKSASLNVTWRAHEMEMCNPVWGFSRLFIELLFLYHFLSYLYCNAVFFFQKTLSSYTYMWIWGKPFFFKSLAGSGYISQLVVKCHSRCAAQRRVLHIIPVPGQAHDRAAFHFSDPTAVPTRVRRLWGLICPFATTQMGHNPPILWTSETLIICIKCQM